jgi:hypothetical protein
MRRQEDRRRMLIDNPVLRQRTRSASASASLGYLTALAIGLSLVLWVFPRWALTGGLPPGAPPRPDFGKDVLGQLYFFSQSWSSGSPGSFLIDRRLNAPWGASIAMTDSIPLLAVLAKLLRPVLPAFDQTISIYQAAAWVLQPVAAVFALRSAGERRWLPALAVAVLAVSMPTFLFRLWHAALTGHCFLLAMLGLYLRIMRGSRPALACACALQVLLLLVHPYLMFMGSALLVAAPLSLYLRGEPWRRTLLAVAASTGVMLLVGQLLGYWGAGSDGGFGYYSMNLVAPFWPTFSTLAPGIPFVHADGTGGQADGYQYLGLGLLGLLAVSAVGWPAWWTHIRRHPGLAIVCIGLSVLAITNWVFFMHTRILHVPLPSMLFSQVRGSGRLFWPVAYALLITSSIVTLRIFPRGGSLVLLALSLVQFADAQQLRRIDHADLANPTPYPFDRQRLAGILMAHDRLTLLPTFPCNGGGLDTNVDLLWIAGRTRMTTNGMYMAREAHARDCLPRDALGSRPGPGEIRVILPGFRPMLAALPNGAEDCRVLEPYILCTRRIDLLAGLPAFVIRPVPMSMRLPLQAGTSGTNVLMAGWNVPEAAPGGVWSNAPSAYIGARLDSAPAGAVRIRINARAMPVLTWLGWTQHRPVSVWAGTHRIADWMIGPKLGDFEAVVPADWVREKGMVMVELRTGRLASTLDQGRTTDPRRFGIWIDAVTFSPVS